MTFLRLPPAGQTGLTSEAGIWGPSPQKCLRIARTIAKQKETIRLRGRKYQSQRVQ